MVLSVVSDKEDVEEKEGKAMRSHFLYKNDQMYTDDAGIGRVKAYKLTNGMEKGAK